MKILVVEDESIFLNTLLIMLDEMGYEDVYSTDNSEKALELFLSVQPDLLLLDIWIEGKKDGIEVAEIISKSPKPVPVIFITSVKDDDNFERAKKTNPLNYIIKPFDENTLKRSIELAVYKFHQGTWDNELFVNWNDDIVAKDSIFIKQNQRLIKVLIAHIIYITADLKYVEIKLNNQTFLIRIALSDLEQKLSNDIFVRVSRSQIINMNFIDNIDLINNQIILKNKEKIAISRRYREQLMKKINILQ